jgi:PAS domain S-box-containing protein
MKAHWPPLTLGTSRRWLISLPFMIALVTLVFLAWCTFKSLVYVDDGINIYSNGQVSDIYPDSPAYGKLQPNDTIINVNGVPFDQAMPFYKDIHAGDAVKFAVLRDEKLVEVTIQPRNPPVGEIARRLVPLLIALVFWAIGVGAQAFKPLDRSVALFFVWCMACAILLVSSAASSLLPIWSAGLFSFMVWLIGPISVHFHMYFPQVAFPRLRPYLLTILYVQALILGLPYLVWGPQVLHTFPKYELIGSFSYFFLAVNLLLVVSLLVYDYRHEITPGTRGRIRILMLGDILSIVPLVTLIFLPVALLNQTIVPYSFAFLFLGIVPLTYGYVIFRHRMIAFEKHVNRGATFILVYSTLGGIYLVFYTIFRDLLLINTSVAPFLNTLLVLVLASIFVPLRQRVQMLVDTLFYGGWYDYRSAVTHITQGSEQITELNPLALTVADRLVRTLHLEDAVVFLRDLDGAFSVIEVAPRESLTNESHLSFTVLPLSSLTFLLKMGNEVGRSSLRKALAEVTLTPEEHRLLNSEQDHLWVPIIGHGQIQGMLALGPKFGGDIFSGEDLDILRVVSRQISPVIENIHLLTRLRQHALELEQRVDERTAELHDAKERVEAILTSVGDGVVVTDLDGTILIVNTAFEDQTGYLSTELLGQQLFTLLADQNDPRQLDEIRLTLQRGEIWMGELVGRRKESLPYDIHLTLAPVRDQVGRMVSYVGSQRDITRQKELDRLKDMFVADVSHELRTPTTNISLYLELLEDAPPAKRAEYLEVLKEQSYLLRKLVEDILDLSRLTMGKTKRIEFAAVDLNQLTEQVVIAHWPLAESSGVSLTFDPAEGLPFVKGEKNQLARVITNLVSNAVRYTLQGEVQVRTFEGDLQVCLEVKDTGIGIALDDQAHIFERFYRGRQVRQSKIHGTGLGLAIVKEIVDLHEGSINIASEIGKGSTFQIWLPVHQSIEIQDVDENTVKKNKEELVKVG